MKKFILNVTILKIKRKKLIVIFNVGVCPVWPAGRSATELPI
jgi:hypothetical protein